jgi:hypothetical protein
MAEVPAVGRGYLLHNKRTGLNLYHRQDSYVGADHTLGGPDFWWFLDKAKWGYRLRTFQGDLRVLDSNHERQVFAIAANSGTYQMWNIYPEDDGFCVVVNLATGFALDSNSTDVYRQSPNDGPNQRWQFDPMD